MTKHTPGPWRIGDAGHTIFGPKQADGSLAPTIATLGPAKGAWRDNGRLIAAAPDLLAALKGAVQAWDLSLNSGSCGRVIPDWLVQARAAIAKAEG